MAADDWSVSTSIHSSVLACWSVSKADFPSTGAAPLAHRLSALGLFVSGMYKICKKMQKEVGAISSPADTRGH
jgi:hypothetical protein